MTGHEQMNALHINGQCVACKCVVGLWDSHIATKKHAAKLQQIVSECNASKFVLKLTTLTSRVAAKRDPEDPTFIPHTRHSPRDSDIDESMEDDPALPEDPALPPISFSMTLCFLVFTFRGGCEIGITLKSF